MHPRDFHSFSSTHHGISRTVYSNGEGPPVVILPEIPGLHTSTFSLGRTIVSHGFRVYLLSLFGEDNQPFRYRDALKELTKACIRKEFAIFARHRSSPIVDWIRSFCRTIAAPNPTKGIGLIGMCLTGNFALGLLAEPWMLAPVLSQPSLPFGLPSDLHMDPNVIEQSKTKDSLKILGLRFTHDILCPKRRFERLKKEFPNRFHGIEIDSSLGNQHNIPPYAHSVLTKDLVDVDGHPTQRALQHTIAFLKTQLRAT